MKEESKSRSDSEYEPTPGDLKAADLGKKLGLRDSEKLVRTVTPMKQTERILFFSGYLSGTVAHMAAALGAEATCAVIDALQEIANGKPGAPPATVRSEQREPSAWLVKSSRLSMGQPWRWASTSKEAAEGDVLDEKRAGAAEVEVVPLYERDDKSGRSKCAS